MIDIKEFYIPRHILEILLKDRTTGQNILWGTDQYGFDPKSHIEIDQIISGDVIKPRVLKSLEDQKFRTDSKAEVYTPIEIIKKMNDAVDKCIDVLGRQLRKNKSKLEKRLRKGSLEELVAPAEEPEIEEEDYTIVRTKDIPVKPISVEEAILQMNMVGHKFYMFTNADTNEVNVVYLRDDGKYGLLVPTTED